MGDKVADFSGWATKSNIKCSDGRTIMANAFKDQDKMTVPLVWQHSHNEPTNVLGHATLENRAFGVYTYGFFNETDQGKNAKTLVQHKDVSALSIYANKLVQKGNNVMHGNIVELSLVLAGANPGAYIDNVNLQHGDTFETLDDEAIIYTGLTLSHSDTSDEDDDVEEEEPDEAETDAVEGEEVDAEEKEEDAEEPTAQEVFDSLNEEQLEMAHFLISEALTGNSEDLQDKTLSHANKKGVTNMATDTKTDEKTVKDVFDSLSEEQKNVVYFMIGEALDGANSGDDSAAHSDDIDTDAITHSITEGFNDLMTRNVFDQSDASPKNATLSHDQLSTIVADAKKSGSFKEAFLAHAAEYGIDDIDLLFPDAKTISNDPDLLSRRMEWVSVVLGGTKHTPFAKVKSLTADITAEEARAKGYIKGNLKKDEVVKLLRRTTSPTTVYKKQKLDRDDILDITDLDVVAWLKAEIRIMLEEEIARAILFGDGRDSLSEDKIKDPEGSTDGTGIRSILHDSDLYAYKANLAANVAPKDAVKGLVRARSNYRGSGKPTLFISDAFLTDIMLEEDKFGRALYETEQSLADKLRVSAIVTVDVIDDTENLLAIMVNLADYTIGANKGGELTSFEDFDIDYNQNKYLTETRISGALTKPYSAIVVTRSQGTSATPTAPSFDGATNKITIPTTTGVVYTIDGDAVTGLKTITDDTEVEAEAADGYYIPVGSTKSWNFTFTAV